MINKVIEEALTNLIRRVEDLENINAQLKSQDKYNKDYYGKTVSQKRGQRRGLATSGQLNYIKGLGGEVWDEMTSDEAGVEIDNLKEEKRRRTNTPEQIYDVKGAENYAKKEMTRISKPLTKEQLKEMENLGKKYDGEALL